jgi:hypothetical protein
MEKDTVLGIAHSENSSADFHHLYLKRRGFQQGRAFWGSHRHHFTHWGEIPPKMAPGIGIPGLNQIMNNFITIRAIQTQIAQAMQSG